LAQVTRWQLTLEGGAVGGEFLLRVPRGDPLRGRENSYLKRKKDLLDNPRGTAGVGGQR